jgi:hypothetical protein
MDTNGMRILSLFMYRVWGVKLLMTKRNLLYIRN